MPPLLRFAAAHCSNPREGPPFFTRTLYLLRPAIFVLLLLGRSSRLQRSVLRRSLRVPLSRNFSRECRRKPGLPRVFPSRTCTFRPATSCSRLFHRPLVFPLKGDFLSLSPATHLGPGQQATGSAVSAWTLSALCRDSPVPTVATLSFVPRRVSLQFPGTSFIFGSRAPKTSKRSHSAANSPATIIRRGQIAFLGTKRFLRRNICSLESMARGVSQHLLCFATYSPLDLRALLSPWFLQQLRGWKWRERRLNRRRLVNSFALIA